MMRFFGKIKCLIFGCSILDTWWVGTKSGTLAVCRSCGSTKLGDEAVSEAEAKRLIADVAPTREPTNDRP